MTKKQTKTKKTSGAKQPKSKENLETIRCLLDTMEDNIRAIKKTLFSKNYQEEASRLKNPSGVIEGVFDGEEMIDKKGKKYSIPPNYASKSKLVPGDVLKLTITPDGGFVFKQIGPTERKKLIGIVHEEEGKFYVKVEDKNYNILLASATYFKLKERDKVTIIVPKNQDSTWAAVENKIE